MTRDAWYELETEHMLAEQAYVRKLRFGKRLPPRPDYGRFDDFTLGNGEVVRAQVL